MRLDVLGRAESVDYLHRRAGSPDTVRLGELADLVGDLPLALAEIAGYVDQTRIGLVEYLDLLRGRARELFGLTGLDSLEQGSAEADRRRVATVWSVSLDQIRTRAPAAEALMTLWAFLAPGRPAPATGHHPPPRTPPRQHDQLRLRGIETGARPRSAAAVAGRCVSLFTIRSPAASFAVRGLSQQRRGTP